MRGWALLIVVALAGCLPELKPSEDLDTGPEEYPGYLCDFYPDNDGDGFGVEDPDAAVQSDCELELGGYVQVADGVFDCDDGQPTVYPGAEEICDLLDNDCNGEIDEGVEITWYQDLDGDTWGGETTASGCEAPDGYVADGGDCDDSTSEIYPGAPAECTDGDMNCDGVPDDVDADGDGYAGCSEDGVLGDCDDTDAAINPDADELCDDFDGDCDGIVDEEPADGTDFYMDADGDGYGDPDNAVNACEAPAGYLSDASDCADSNAEISPDAAEECDGTDNDCDDAVDEDGADAATWYGDADGDGYGGTDTTTTACNEPDGYSATADDCDDTDPAYNPGASEDDCSDPNDYNCDGATGYVDGDGDGYAACEECDDGDATINPDADELCDIVDNDCDGIVDNDAVDADTWYADSDSDAYGDPDTTATSCGRPAGYIADNTDCDDSVGVIHPGAPEACNDADDDCDSAIDEDAVNPDTWYADDDGDGYGDPDDPTEACDLPAGYSENALDCDDGDEAAYPEATEVCDGADNDCNGFTDENSAVDVQTWYGDADGDGYGGTINLTQACDQPSGYVANDDDCRDGDADDYPGADEYCDLFDNDCDGEVDEAGAVDATPRYADDDGDGYGDPDDSADSCTRLDGYVDDATDCDDSEYSVNPGWGEFCDALDNDCDGTVDEETSSDATWYGDTDGDGYGDKFDKLSDCEQPSGYVSNPDDCDDDAADVSPAEDEVCNGVDDDCDEDIDEAGAVDASTWYHDNDNDTFGDAGDAEIACDAPTDHVSDNTDCDDTAGGAYPGAKERCDGADQDCDDRVDEDATDGTTWYPDLDGDTYGSSSEGVVSCDSLSGYVSNGLDCDDDYAGTYTGAEELCDSDDNDCDGTVDEGASDCESICPVYTDPSVGYSGDGSADSPFASITEALKGRGDCGEIAVGPGTYYETVDFEGADVHVYSTDGAASTIIDANGGGSAVTFANGETSDAILEGLTLTGGSGTKGSGYSALDSSTEHGGGIFIYQSDPTITDCVIEDNLVSGQGAGIYAYDWYGSLSDSEVSDNDAEGQNYSGGGIAIVGGGPYVLWSDVVDNDASGSSGDGGGLYIEDASPIVMYNWIEGNSASGTGDGLRMRETEAWVVNNVIVGHSGGYAIAVTDSDGGYLINNTIDDNQNGIYSSSNEGSSPWTSVINNQITNSASYGAYLSSASYLDWYYNNVWGSGSSDYVYSSWYFYGEYYDYSEDPDYVDASGGDYDLDTSSPHVDAGYDLSGYVDDDYEGTSRPQGSGYSIGAYE